MRFGGLGQWIIGVCILLYAGHGAELLSSLAICWVALHPIAFLLHHFWQLAELSRWVLCVFVAHIHTELLELTFHMFNAFDWTVYFEILSRQKSIRKRCVARICEWSKREREIDSNIIILIGFVSEVICIRCGISECSPAISMSLSQPVFFFLHVLFRLFPFSLAISL